MKKSVQKSKPIIFGQEMDRALIDGRKTQHRIISAEFNAMKNMDSILSRFPHQRGCKYGEIGDLLWLQESFSTNKIDTSIWYWNDGEPIEDFNKKKLPQHMPRLASRITLEIIDIRVERLQDISEEDAQSEGTERGMLKTMGGEFILYGGSYTCGFINLWQSIYGPDSWTQNPWIWVIEFEVIRKNIDDVIREMGTA